MNGLPSWSFAGDEEEERGRESGVGVVEGWGGGNKITRSGGSCVAHNSTVEDVDRASQGKPSPQGETSLGLSVPVQGSDCNYPRT